MNDQPLTVKLAEAFGSKSISQPRLDELERKLREAFGEEAAELDNRARGIAGMDEVKFPSPSDGDGCLLAPLSLTTWPRLLFVALYAAALTPFIDAAVNVANFPR